MKKLLIIAALLCTYPVALLAHHGHTSQFDPETIIEISGEITDLAFVNPHAYVYVDVKDESGNVVNYYCEMRAGSLMRRSGWTKEMFTNGTKVDIVGIASRKEANGCYIETIAFNGGAPIERYAQIDANKLAADAESSRPAKTAWGVPNIAGDWAAEQRLVGAISGPGAGGGAGGMGAGAMGAGAMGGRAMGGMGARGGTTTLTDAGTAALERITAAASAEAGRLDCSPRDFFSDWTFDQHPNSVIQEEDKITLKYGFMETTRVIHLNASHPANLEPSWAGHSVGFWHNDELYVDTVGFTEHERRGTPRSEQYHAFERFSLDAESGALNRFYMATDPTYWAKGYIQTGSDSVKLSDYPYEPYECDDRTIE